MISQYIKIYVEDDVCKYHKKSDSTCLRSVFFKSGHRKIDKKTSHSMKSNTFLFFS